MSVRRVKRKDPRTGKTMEYWMVDVVFEHADGRPERIRKVSPVQTRVGAEQYERNVRQALVVGGRGGVREEVPRFDEWFEGRFWREWVLGRKNKPSEQRSKLCSYRVHIKPALGHKRLDEIGVGVIAKFRADLVEKELGEKTINNILTVVSKPLKYAVDVEILAKSPKVGLFKVEAPEIVAWEMAQYARILAAADEEGPTVYAALCLAGEAGLRVGEVKGLRWREDVDMIGKTITVNQQIQLGSVGTPKGRTRRTVPMTDTLYAALAQISTVREGYVIRNLGGQAKNDENQIKNLSYRICRRAGLPECGWHKLRHTFGTHAALFEVNPWRLMTWLGHKAITQTIGYVHVAESHRRDIPPELLAAAEGHTDPTRRVLKMLGARVLLRQPDGNTTAPTPFKLTLVKG